MSINLLKMVFAVFLGVNSGSDSRSDMWLVSGTSAGLCMVDVVLPHPFCVGKGFDSIILLKTVLAVFQGVKSGSGSSIDL